jgi:hypothetical protein
VGKILLLENWVTTHHDFVPQLDKPIYFSILSLFLSALRVLQAVAVAAIRRKFFPP